MLFIHSFIYLLTGWMDGWKEILHSQRFGLRPTTYSTVKYPHHVSGTSTLFASQKSPMLCVVKLYSSDNFMNAFSDDYDDYDETSSTVSDKPCHEKKPPTSLSKQRDCMSLSLICLYDFHTAIIRPTRLHVHIPIAISIESCKHKHLARWRSCSRWWPICRRCLG